MADIKVFNSAKLFSEHVVFPLIKSHSEAKLITRLGAISIAEANKIFPNQRIINRYNATKERVILQQTLINEIESTILINGVQVEIEMLDSIKTNLNMIEEQFDERKEEIMVFENIKGVKTPILTKMFSEINRYLDSTYVQITKLMTKNKLLFVSASDDYIEDQELKEKIKADNLKA